MRFPNTVVSIDGALDLVEGPNGVSPKRMPRWTSSRIHDDFLAFDVAATAGVRLAFSTASTRLLLTFRCNALQLDSLFSPAAIDVVIDGRFLSRHVVPTSGRIAFTESGQVATIEGPETVVIFRELGAGSKDVELWLPHTASCELVAIEGDAPIDPPRPKERSRWIHYGSSISHCLEALGPVDTWPSRFALKAGLDLVNLGFAGQAVLDPFVARVIRETDADLISLKIGINIVGTSAMNERTFHAAVEGFVDTLRDGHPRTPLIIVSAIACPQFESDATDGRLSLERSREILQDVVAKRQDANDDAISYLDGRQLLGPDEVNDLPDGIHPSPEAYLRIGDRFGEFVGLSFPLSAASARKNPA